MEGCQATEEENHKGLKTTTEQAMSGQGFHVWGAMIRSKVGWRQLLYGSLLEGRARRRAHNGLSQFS